MVSRPRSSPWRGSSTSSSRTPGRPRRPCRPSVVGSSRESNAAGQGLRARGLRVRWISTATSRPTAPSGPAWPSSPAGRSGGSGALRRRPTSWSGSTSGSPATLLRPDLLPRPGLDGQAERAGGPGRVGGVRHPAPDPAGLRALLHRPASGGGRRPLVRGRGRAGHRAPASGSGCGWPARPAVEAAARRPSARPTSTATSRSTTRRPRRPSSPPRCSPTTSGRLPGLRPRHLLLRRDPVRAGAERRPAGAGRRAVRGRRPAGPSSGA